MDRVEGGVSQNVSSLLEGCVFVAVKVYRKVKCSDNVRGGDRRGEEGKGPILAAGSDGCGGEGGGALWRVWGVVLTGEGEEGGGR